MIYKTFRATNPVRWRDGDGWQVGWRLYLVGWHTAGAVNRWWVRSPNDRLALVSVWGSPEPIFVPEDELEEMPMREKEGSTSLDAKPGTWESAKAGTWDVSAWAGQSTPNPFFPLDKAEVVRVMSEAEQLAAARAEANDLMQRLTESQQEVAKLKHETQQLKEIRDQLWSDKKTLEHDNGLLERDRDEARQELAEVKAERDRLAAQVEEMRKEIVAQSTAYKIYRDRVTETLRDLGLIL